MNTSGYDKLIKAKDAIFTYFKNMFNPPHVTWLSWKDTKKQSIAVICITAVSTLLIAGFDLLVNGILSLL